MFSSANEAIGTKGKYYYFGFFGCDFLRCCLFPVHTFRRTHFLSNSFSKLLCFHLRIYVPMIPQCPFNDNLRLNSSSLAAAFNYSRFPATHLSAQDVSDTKILFGQVLLSRFALFLPIRFLCTHLKCEYFTWLWCQLTIMSFSLHSTKMGWWWRLDRHCTSQAYPWCGEQPPLNQQKYKTSAVLIRNRVNRSTMLRRLLHREQTKK